MRREAGFYVLFRNNIIITLFLAVILTSCSNPSNQSVISGGVRIDNIHEISQGDRPYLSNPLKMTFYEDKIFILYAKLQKISVFSNSGYLYGIGRPGKGPGELANAISFDITDQKIFVVNFPGRIEVFDLYGNYERSIQLTENGQLFSTFWDIKVLKRQIFLSLYAGQIKVKRYRMDGTFIDNFVGDSKTNHSGYQLPSPYQMHLVPERNCLVLLNQFNGDIEIYDLRTGKLKGTIKNYDADITGRTAQIEERINSGVGEDKLRMKIILMLRSAIDWHNHRLIVFPSQSTLKKDEKKDIIYVYNFDSNLLQGHTLQFLDGEPRYIKNCCFMKCRVAFLDEDLNLLLGEYR